MKEMVYKIHSSAVLPFYYAGDSAHIDDAWNKVRVILMDGLTEFANDRKLLFEMGHGMKWNSTWTYLVDAFL